jgi:hypothetical protein
VSEAEHPDRRRPDHEVTVEDVRQLAGPATPHFALQIRGRIARLIEGLPEDHPARLEGEGEMARLATLGFSGEVRGTPHEPGIEPLPSVDPRSAA